MKQNSQSTWVMVLVTMKWHGKAWGCFAVLDDAALLRLTVQHSDYRGCEEKNAMYSVPSSFVCPQRASISVPWIELLTPLSP